jgi:signal transduction histidine kinase
MILSKPRSVQSRQKILHDLGERVKELTALHQTARILQNHRALPLEVLRDIVDLLPPAWQYPEITAARIRFNGTAVATPNLRETPWRQSAEFTLSGGQHGEIEVWYLEETPPEIEGPFLAEERNLINSLAEMLRSYFERREAQEALQRAHDGLELRVKERTAELVSLNKALEAEIAERKRTEEKIRSYQEQLRSLASELSLTEERERRAIATDLHDHIGQILALTKIKLGELQQQAKGRTLEEIRELVEQSIQYTRSLTFELSPPILYELGFQAAVEWLAEQMQEKHGIRVSVDGNHAVGPLSDDIRMFLFKAVRELLLNVAKHAQASQTTVSIRQEGENLRIAVADNGLGFDVSQFEGPSGSTRGFGLFSVRERSNHFGGQLEINSQPGKGTTAILFVPLQLGNGHEP